MGLVVEEVVEEDFVVVEGVEGVGQFLDGGC